MKNLYNATLKLCLGIDSFVVFPTYFADELCIFSHYIPKNILSLRSGDYVIEVPKEVKEGEAIVESRGLTFLPDSKNIFSNVIVKEQSENSITVNCDLFIEKKEALLQVAFCDFKNQNYVIVAPIDVKKKLSSIGDRKYYTGFKKVGDSTIYTPFEF